MSYYKTIDFSKFSSIKIGPVVDVYMIEECQYPKGAYLLGGANNVLIPPAPPPLMMLSKKYDYIKIEDDLLVIGAATPGGKVVSFCKKHNIANFEFMAHLPGTIGGMVKMNAGLKEWEIFNNLHSITVDCERVSKEEIDYGYRYCNISGVVFEARFHISRGFKSTQLELFKKMRSNQSSEFSAGSCFKNPKDDYAGRLIEVVGLKEKRLGDMAFSDKHANFLVNFADGSYRDAVTLIEEAERLVF
ncbi:MAG: UDP-N-acetylmuramate dehydrogenase, partial [Campylobacterota bacterium]|nr:UDP-N-acetylmuramate dehydrogenase [Campylobacterota bacterium]